MKEAKRACPTCGGELREPRGPAFPFCSHECKLVDLGRWLDGSYRVAGPPAELLGQGDGTERG